ncbi:MAG: arginine--tRNA ligase [Porphyromonadaceae bacterium CG2_30_38_12]|nr:MAG: arginine--tRNA ligase [Porphyromonadaceae bacterium CG2_30_38_12]
MSLESKIQFIVSQSVLSLYKIETEASHIQIQKTKKEFEGDLTVVVFPFVKAARKSPEATGQEIGALICQQNPLVTSFNVIKGFLNLTISKTYWLDTLTEIFENHSYGIKLPTADSDIMMIEYSSPNTNKPLHLGHIRNNLLGFSISEIQKANGWQVVKTNIVNDRGIHICKSMLAWQKFGNAETPQSTGMKGDHLVGKYYVVFDQAYKVQIAELIEKGATEDEAKKNAPLIVEAQQMLLAWERNDPQVRQLWETMNGWVYAGFDQTYIRMGVNFDKIYYESETYLIGKEEVERGVRENEFYVRPDKSVWADLTSKGLDEKLLLRADGTSVYMTQDIGTAKLRYDDYDIKKMVYVVGNEQNYHFQVLSLLLDKLGYSWGNDLVHFSYGMVELPEGKMKSREGTVVDADDLMAEMIDTARDTAIELGKLEQCTSQEIAEVARIVGLGALKYFILKVDPRKNMTFNPRESIDFNGNTGPFIQYTHARIKSVLRKAVEQHIDFGTKIDNTLLISEKETNLIQLLTDFPSVIKQAGDEFSPALVANYCYELVKEFNQFYHDFSILKEENEALKKFRLQLAASVANVVKIAMGLLGIEVPERM